MPSYHLHCNYCPSKFSTIDLLMEHITYKCDNRLHSSSPSTWHCGNCTRHYNDKRTFKRHVIEKHVPSVVESPLRHRPSPSVRVPYSPYKTPEKVRPTSPPLLQLLSPVQARRLPTPTSLKEVETYLTEQVSSMIASFHNNPGMTEKSVQMFYEAFQSFQQDVLYVALHRLYDFYEDVDGQCEHLLEFMNHLKIILEQCNRPFRTIHVRMKHFKDAGTYIAPEPIYLANEFRQGRLGPRQRQVVAQFIPIRQVLAKLLSIPSLLDEMRSYVDSMKDPVDGVQHFMHSPNWASMMSRCDPNDDCIWFPIHLYFDEFESGNPLGSRAGRNKLGAVYMSLPALPIRLVHKIKFIFLVMLFRAGDKSIITTDTVDQTPVGNSVFQKVIDEMNYLQEVGVEVQTGPSRRVQVKFLTGCLLGDNLGLNQICGFVESFSSPHCCRYCTDDYKTAPFVEDPNSLRNADNYAEALALNDVRSTGVKERCVWLGIRGFDLFANTNPDHMHDFLEGACYYVMYEVIKGLIAHDILTLSTLNSRLKSFPFGPESNAPSEVYLISDRAGGGRLRKMSANEVRVFVCYFGLLIGDLVDEYDYDFPPTRKYRGRVVPVAPPAHHQFYDLYLKLLDVLELLSCTRVTTEVARSLREKVQELLSAYLSISNRTHVPPKLHFLIHYCEAMLRNGPSISLSSMAFERKHRDLKRSLNAISTTVNTPLSAAKKIQLQLNSLLTANEIPPNRFVPGRLTSVRRDVVDPLLDHYRLPRNTSFKKARTMESPLAIPYSIDNIICYHLKSNDNDEIHPHFAKIIQLFYNEDNDLAIALAQPYRTLGWSRHFHAYHVQTVYSLDAAIWVDLSSLDFPFPNTYVDAYNGNEYIFMRNSTSHFIY